MGGRRRLGLVRDENEHHRSTHSVDNNKILEEQVAWVNQQQECGEEIFTFSGSDDCMVKSTNKKNAVKLKSASARIQVEVSGKKMWLWVDIGSPVTILSMTDLKSTLGKTNLHLQPTLEAILDYNNIWIHILGKIAVTMALNR